jgi:hypothetical protein
LVAATAATSDDGLQESFRVLLNKLDYHDKSDVTWWI